VLDHIGVVDPRQARARGAALLAPLTLPPRQRRASSSAPASCGQAGRPWTVACSELPLLRDVSRLSCSTCARSWSSSAAWSSRSVACSHTSATSSTRDSSFRSSTR
jgi:hypothetical protein